MAEGTSNSNDYETGTSENNSQSDPDEFREMIDVALNLDTSNETSTDKTSIEDQTINQALLTSIDICNDNGKLSSLNTTTAVSVAELPDAITDPLNVAAKQLCLLRESASDGVTSEQDEGFDDEASDRVNELASGSAEIYSASDRSQIQTLSTEPKPTASLTTNDNKQPKRHIMISYNRSSRDMCQRIYNRLVGLDYKVWMDLTDMGDDILVSMARAVENSYIVLLCMSKEYYESDYCRLEAEYAAENRIKFIPCLMQTDFRPESWLGIIKGSNFHIDFTSSTDENFEKSFNELIRQITYVERRLSLQPRRTPAPSACMVNPMKLASMSSPKPSSTSSAQILNSRRFDAIIREYKHTIKKKSCQLNHLKRNELSDLILKLRQELFSETSQTLTDSDRSDEEDEKPHTDTQVLEQLLNRSLDQNEILLRLVDRLTTPPLEQPNNPNNLDVNGIIKVIIAIMLLWALSILYQKE